MLLIKKQILVLGLVFFSCNEENEKFLSGFFFLLMWQISCSKEDKFCSNSNQSPARRKEKFLRTKKEDKNWLYCGFLLIALWQNDWKLVFLLIKGSVLISTSVRILWWNLLCIQYSIHCHFSALTQLWRLDFFLIWNNIFGGYYHASCTLYLQRCQKNHLSDPFSKYCLRWYI